MSARSTTPEARLLEIALLSAGAARDLDRPIGYLLANLTFLESQLCMDAGGLPAVRATELRRCAREALDGAGRLRDIIRGLQMGGHLLDDDADVELHPLLLSCIKVARTEVNHRDPVVTEFDAVPTVRGSETRLARLFSNLIRNAAEAVAGDSAREPFIRVSTRTDPSRCDVVDIADSGPGVPPEIGARIFEPFFTTKPQRGNTGLGLSTCRQIALDLGGSVELQSHQGHGALFRVTLPNRRASGAASEGPETGRFASSRPPVRRLSSGAR